MILLSFETLLLFLGLAVVLGGVGGYFIRRAEKRLKVPKGFELRRLGELDLTDVFNSIEMVRKIVSETGLKVYDLNTVQFSLNSMANLLSAFNKKQDIANGLMLKSFPKAMEEQGKMTNDFYSSVQGQLSDLKKMVSKALKVRAESSKKGKKK